MEEDRIVVIISNYPKLFEAVTRKVVYLRELTTYPLYIPTSSCDGDTKSLVEAFVGI